MAMYNVSEMKAYLEGAIQVAKDRVKDQFASSFREIYTDNLVPESFPTTVQRIDRVVLTVPDELTNIYYGAGFYVIFTDWPVEDNPCQLRCGALRAIYRGECATTKKRVTSHLFHAKYKEEYAARKAAYMGSPENQKKEYYEDFWPQCLKLESGGPSGVNIDQEPHRRYRWLVVVHRMDSSSQEVRKLAELAFDQTFGRPKCSREA